MWHINELDENSLDRLLKTSLESGIDTFDHADIYGDYSCEEKFGQWLKANPSYRSEIKLISKCGIKLLSEKHPEHKVKHYDTSADHIIRSVKASLKKLRADHLDLYLIHRPDPLMQPDEVARAFDDLHSRGLVKHFGVSNFTPPQFELLQAEFGQKLITNQIEVSLARPEAMFDGTIDFLMKNKINPIAWSPMGGVGQVKSLVENVEVREIAEKYDFSSGQIILSWLLAHPADIVPVLGTMKPERIVESVKAVEVKLERQDWFSLLDISRGYKVP